MADPTPPREDLGALVSMFRDLDRRVRSLEKPTGTQYASAVAGLTDVRNKVVAFGSIGKSTTAFAVPPNYGDVAGGAIPVPDGFTSAALLGIVSVGAWNASATGDYLYVRCMVNGSPGASLPVFAGTSAYGTVGASAIRTLSGLAAGDSIDVSAQCKASSGWGTNGANIANIDVIALFSR